ncbi:DUF5347 domain-containing protein [Gammaproteobacteria bacterium]|nr:DUF5347 domain-containing protein [Gammaproteobacteria bacterium]
MKKLNKKEKLTDSEKKFLNESFKLLDETLEAEMRILQMILFVAGYSKESAIGQPPDTTVFLTNDQIDIIKALDEIKAIISDNTNYHSTSKNCSATVLQILSGAVKDPNLNKKLRRYKNMPYGNIVITPRVVYKAISQQPKRISLLLKSFFSTLLKKLKTVELKLISKVNKPTRSYKLDRDTHMKKEDINTSPEDVALTQSNTSKNGYKH